MDTNEINNKDFPKRIKALTEYLNQGIYGQEYVIKQLLLFALAKRKIEVKTNDEVLKNIVCRRVSAAFKEFYNDENFSVPVSGIILNEITISEIPEENFFDFITDGNIELVPTEEQKSLLFSMEEVNNMQKEIKKIRLSDGVKWFITLARNRYSVTGWQDFVHVAQMSAFLNGRDLVSLTDISNISIHIRDHGRDYYDTCSLYIKNHKSIRIDNDYFYDGYGNRIHGYAVDKYTYGKYNKYNDKDSEIVSEIKNLIEIFKDCVIVTYEPSAVEILKKHIKEKYSLLSKELDKQIAVLNSYKAELNIENIFACKEELDKMLAEIDEHFKNFENTKNKIKEIYDKIEFSFVDDIDIGDCICLDGSVNSSDDDVAVICIKGNTADSLYGASTEAWKETSFDEAEQIAESYTCNGSSVYSKDWSIPTIEQLEQIYENREELDTCLDYELTGKFWSSTKKDNDAVYFFDFDKGKKDYTTPDHEYNLLLIHRFGE